MSTLVCRKGADLLVGTMPQTRNKFPNTDFAIGGNGSKRSSLEEMVKREQTQHRTAFVGSVPYENARNESTQGHAFLNCSSTESFCVALLEAAPCRLCSVSTNLGGVLEALPNDVCLADPNTSSLVHGLTHALSNDMLQSANPHECHKRV